MRKYLFFLATLAYAQTAKFPTSIATDADLLKAKDRSASTLANSIDAITLTVPVTSGAQFTYYEVITIDNEQMLICSISGNTLTVCGRGFGGTTAASHNSGVSVRGQIVAWHHNALSAEVKAIENHLGTAKTAGSIIFAGSGGAYSEDNSNLFWDNANKRLGIGTSSPLYSVDVSGRAIRLGLDKTGGGRLVITSNPNDNKVIMEAFSSDMSSSASEFSLAGKYGGNVPIVGLFGDKVYIPGIVGIGTPNPTSPLQVTGLPVYANNAAAIAGGLTVGALYRTGGDPDVVCVVH